MKEQITQARVKELFDYRKDGVLLYLVGRKNHVKPGSAAGWADGHGYLRVTIDGEKHRVHRLIWLWHHGYLPENDIDHINRDRSDNRVENLREVTRACNLRNSGLYSTNTSGIKGISWTPDRQKWQAKICLFGMTKHLCFRADMLEATCHRLAAEQSVGWLGCDSSSPAYLYVKGHIPSIK